MIKSMLWRKRSRITLEVLTQMLLFGGSKKSVLGLQLCSFHYVLFFPQVWPEPDFADRLHHIHGRAVLLHRGQA